MTFSHCLGEEEALRRLENLCAELREEFADKIREFRQERTADGYKFYLLVVEIVSFSVSGRLTVGSESVELVYELPFAAIFFKKKVEEYKELIKKRVEDKLHSSE